MRFRSLFLFALLAATPVSAADAGLATESFEGVILTSEPAPCSDGRDGCLALRMGTGRDQEIQVLADPASIPGGSLIAFHPGDRLILERFTIADTEQVIVTDIVRRPALGWLFLLFCVCVVLLGGFHALRSLLGMIVSVGVIFFVILPGILAGHSPFLVCLGGSVVIALCTLVIAHGWNAKTAVTLLGMGLSLILTGLLAVTFAWWGQLFGLASEEVTFLLQDLPWLDTRGLLLGAIIIGALGSLDDVAVSQASAVFELKLANASLSWRELYARAIRIGRDHVAAAVNTLVLAYAGAALPLLLLLAHDAYGESWFILLNHETFAAEIVRTFVGSIGLIAAVPFTTLFASLAASRLQLHQLRSGGKQHGHIH